MKYPTAACPICSKIYRVFQACMPKYGIPARRHVSIKNQIINT